MLMYRIAEAGYGFRADDLPLSQSPPTESDGVTPHVGANQNVLRPGFLLARDLADELLVNEARNEVVFVKYLD